MNSIYIQWRGTGGREPGRIGAGGGREAGGDGAGCGSHVRAGGGRRMRDIKFFNDFFVPFYLLQTIKNQNQRILIIYCFDWN